MRFLPGTLKVNDFDPSAVFDDARSVKDEEIRVLQSNGKLSAW